MTATEMVISFKQGLDKFDSNNYPNLLPEEIDLLLNQAQEMFIKQRYGLNNIKREGFEETQKRINDLRTLVKDTTISPALNSTLNINSDAVFVQYPNDYWLTILKLTNISYSDCNSNTVTEDVFTQEIQHDDYTKLIKNPFSKPSTNKVLQMSTSDGIELIPSSDSTINYYKLRYIKKPNTINSTTTPTVDCELPDITHQEVVNKAISIALENIEAGRLKSFIEVTENRQE